MGNNAIEIRNLTLPLKGFTLKNVNLDIPKGMVTGLIGKNGAGKTTLIKALSDIYVPTAGSICYDELEMRANAPQIKEKLGVVFDSLIYPMNFTAKKNAELAAPFFPDFDMEKWKSHMERFGLDPRNKVGAYSKGMQMKFMLAMVLARNPEILIMDEPTAGLDPAARAELIDILQEYMEDENKTVIYSTHITSDLEKFADYIALVVKGQVVLMEEKDQLLESYALVQLEKNAATDELRSKLIGCKENTFGYIGLTDDRSCFESLAGARLAKAQIEDLLIYGVGETL